MHEQATEEDDGPFIEFESPPDKPSRWGLHPYAQGFRRRIASGGKWLAISLAAFGAVGCCLSLAGLLSPLIGPLALLLSVGVAAARHWMLTRGEYCRLCGASTRSPLAKQRLVWCRGCGNLNDPGQLGLRASEIFDVTRPENFYHPEPIVSFLATTLCLAVLDKGSRIVYDPQPAEYRVAISIDSVEHELVPPPAHIQFAVAQTFKVLSGLDVDDCRTSQSGCLDLRVYDQIVAARVLVEPTPSGQRVEVTWAAE